MEVAEVVVLDSIEIVGADYADQNYDVVDDQKIVNHIILRKQVMWLEVVRC